MHRVEEGMDRIDSNQARPTLNHGKEPQETDYDDLSFQAFECEVIGSPTDPRR